MDATHLLTCTARLRVLAHEARDLSAWVEAQHGVAWTSLAASRFRQALLREAVLGRRCADALDDAADAFGAHARAVAASQGRPRP